MVKAAPNLHSFRFSSTRVGTDGGVTLAHALGAGRQPNPPNPHWMSYSTSRLYPKRNPLLRDGLGVGGGGCAGCSLRKVDLRDNMFGPRVGEALAAGLGQHTQLCDLYLSDTGEAARTHSLLTGREREERDGSGVGT